MGKPPGCKIPECADNNQDCHFKLSLGIVFSIFYLSIFQPYFFPFCVNFLKNRRIIDIELSYIY